MRQEERPAGDPPEEDSDEGRRGAAEAVEREMMFMFRRARHVSQTLASRVHPDLDPASYSLLVLVDDAGSLRGMDLTDRIGLDKSTVSRQIGHLETLELLERVPDPSDGRARLIQLTTSGGQRLRQVREERRQHLYAHFESWSTYDLRELSRLFAKLNEAF